MLLIRWLEKTQQLFCLLRPTLQSLLRNFASAIDHCAPKMVVNVDREDVLDGGLRAFSRPAFSASRKLDVKFVGEDGIDGGGLTRDFLRLAVRSLQLSPIFEGDLNARFISLKYTGRHTSHSRPM
jgi:hypothetical protein